MAAAKLSVRSGLDYVVRVGGNLGIDNLEKPGKPCTAACLNDLRNQRSTELGVELDILPRSHSIVGWGRNSVRLANHRPDDPERVANFQNSGLAVSPLFTLGLLCHCANMGNCWVELSHNKPVSTKSLQGNNPGNRLDNNPTTAMIAAASSTICAVH